MASSRASKLTALQRAVLDAWFRDAAFARA
jgi:hypothetical protein